MDELDLVHGIREAQKGGKEHPDRPLWGWSRVHARRQVKAVMIAAGIPNGPHRTPNRCYVPVRLL